MKILDLLLIFSKINIMHVIRSFLDNKKARQDNLHPESWTLLV